MEDTPTYHIRFLNATPAEANIHTADLADHLRHAVPQKERLQIDRQRTSKDSQDFGATLVLILGTAAATAVAKGIRSWLAAHTDTTIEITDETGHVRATNIDAGNAAAIMQAWAQRVPSK